MKLYHRTRTGEQALQRADRFADAHAAVLALIGDITHFDAVSACLPQWSKGRIRRLLNALEIRGLVESVPLEWVRELYRLGAYEPAGLRRATVPARSS